jgi:hypothetical protein
MGKTVVCEVEYVDIENENGDDVEGVEVTCPLCEDVESSYGTHHRSIRRCLALLKENCDCDNYLTT